MKSENVVTPEGLGGIVGRFPVRVGRRVAAEIVTNNFFPVSHRTLERWPLKWRRVNGRALVATSELFAEAQRRVDEAPEIRSGESDV